VAILYRKVDRSFVLHLANVNITAILEFVKLEISIGRIRFMFVNTVKKSTNRNTLWMSIARVHVRVELERLSINGLDRDV
jgi:hypothetical protein